MADKVTGLKLDAKMVALTLARAKLAAAESEVKAAESALEGDWRGYALLSGGRIRAAKMLADALPPDLQRVGIAVRIVDAYTIGHADALRLVKESLGK